MALNIEHLEKIKKHILEEPNRLQMDIWLEAKRTPGAMVFDTYCDIPEAIEQVVPACGTVGCIAGWSAVLDGREYRFQSTERAFLGLENHELFFPDQWPEDLAEDYRLAKTAKEKAEVAARAIDRVIAGEF